ncbi:MAG: oligosaccharide flippase family protein [candidate division WOR-3 bacterium]|nr:oligosaccharide flippase family protein [candidate division WOR-3 bacterium]
MLAQKLILGYGTTVVVQIVQIFASIVVARIAGPTVLGTVAFGLAFVSTFEFIADLGIGPAHVKLISEGRDVGSCISTFAVLKTVNTFVFFIVVVVILLVQRYVLNIAFESTAHEYVIILFLVAITINQLLLIPGTTFAAKTEQAKQSIPEFIRTFIYQVLRVTLVLLGYRAVALAFGNLIATILVIPVILYLFRGCPRAKFDKKLAMDYLRISVPVLFIGIATKVMHNVDKVMLQHFTNSEQLGYYTASYRIGSVVFMMATSVGMLFLPLFSKATSEGNLGYINSTIDRFERFTLIFVMPLVIFLSLYADVIVKLVLGSQYLPSIPLMAIINIAMFLMVLNIPYGNVITGMGFFRLFAILSMVHLAVFMVLICVLPNPLLFDLGITGGAFTLLFSSVFAGVLYRIYAKRKCPLLSLHSNLKYVVFGIVNYIGFAYLYGYLSTMYGATFKIIFLPGYFIVTYGALLIMGWIEKGDLNSLKMLFNLKKIGVYVKGELGNNND